MNWTINTTARADYFPHTFDISYECPSAEYMEKKLNVDYIGIAIMPWVFCDTEKVTEYLASLRPPDDTDVYLERNNSLETNFVRHIKLRDYLDEPPDDFYFPYHAFNNMPYIDEENRANIASYANNNIYGNIVMRHSEDRLARAKGRIDISPGLYSTRHIVNSEILAEDFAVVRCTEKYWVNFSINYLLSGKCMEEHHYKLYAGEISFIEKIKYNDAVSYAFINLVNQENNCPMIMLHYNSIEKMVVIKFIHGETVKELRKNGMNSFINYVYGTDNRRFSQIGKARLGIQNMEYYIPLFRSSPTYLLQYFAVATACNTHTGVYRCLSIKEFYNADIEVNYIDSLLNIKVYNGELLPANTSFTSTTKRRLELFRNMIKEHNNRG